MTDDEETEQQAKSTDSEVLSVRRVSVAEQNVTYMCAVDLEPLKFPCSMGVMVVGGEARGKCVLQNILDGGSGTSKLMETGLRLLLRLFHGLPTVHPFEKGPSVTVADGPYNTPWAPVVIRLAVAVVPGGDDVLILGSKTLRAQPNTDILRGLWAKAMVRGELAEP